MSNYKTGHTLDRTFDKTYRAWGNMKTRCNNPNFNEFHRYGGRGISYCAEWESFQGFLKDMGMCPPGRSLDRKDNNKNYYKDNCRWATKAEQSHNTSTNILSKEIVSCIRYAQETSELGNSEIARQLGKIFGIKPETIRAVLKGANWKEV